MNIFAIIKDIFAPAAKLVDDLHTSDEEKLQQKANMLETYASVLEFGVQFESEQLKAKSRIIEAEAKSEHWLTATWRPITMLTFMAMLAAYWFGWIDPNEAERITPELMSDIFDLMKIGIGGYIGSRGLEKVVPATVNAFKAREDT